MTTKTETTTWVRYRHRNNPKIEYDVECEPVASFVEGKATYLKCYDGFFKIRTVRNLFYQEEIHIPSFTYMPAQHFLSLYERAS